jgi:hypothetical protein
MNALRVESFKSVQTLSFMVRSAPLRASRTMKPLRAVPRMRCTADALRSVRGTNSPGPRPRGGDAARFAQ